MHERELNIIHEIYDTEDASDCRYKRKSTLYYTAQVPRRSMNQALEPAFSGHFSSQE